jgi:hypothetical protein
VVIIVQFIATNVNVVTLIVGTIIIASVLSTSLVLMITQSVVMI